MMFGADRDLSLIRWPTQLLSALFILSVIKRSFGMENFISCEVRPYKDLSGKMFGRLTAVRPVGKQGVQLDRRDNDKGYSKENCRWVTPKQNARNRRTNRLITYGDETYCLAEWAERVGLTSVQLWKRLRWSVERALTTPIRSKRRQHA